MMNWTNINRPHKGQGMMIGIAVIITLGVVTLGATMSQLTFENSQRNVSAQHSMQLYYVAYAGVQEALATRMVPRSNMLNFTESNFPAQGRSMAGGGSQKSFSKLYDGQITYKPYYSLSGRIHVDPTDMTSPMIGLYRYVVLGGDPARDLGTGNYHGSDMDMTNRMSEQYFYVISRGTVCRKEASSGVVGGVLATDAFEIDTIGQISCLDSSDSKPETMTLLAKVDMSRLNSRHNNIHDQDLVVDYRIIPDQDYIQLDEKVFVPGTDNGLTDEIFADGADSALDRVWASYTGNFSSVGDAVAADKISLLPTRIAFHEPEPDDDSDVHVFDIDDPALANTEVPARSIIRIYFQGGVDHRTFFGDPNTNDMEECMAADPNDPDDPAFQKCSFRLERVENGSREVFPQNTIIPIFPGSSQVLLYPPFDASLDSDPNVHYELIISGNISDYSGNKLPAQKTVSFRIDDGN